MGNFEVIESLLLGCTGSIDPEMEKGYVRLPEVNDVTKQFCQALDGSDMDALDDLSIEMASAHERQGFINGFRVAMRLMTEVRYDP